MASAESIYALLPQSVRWENDALYLLDQTRLPAQTVVEKQENVEQVWDSIRRLKVRGAPAIGVAAAYGLCLALQGHRAKALSVFLSHLEKQVDYLDSARPTAVNLRWALHRMRSRARASTAETALELYRELVEEAMAIHAEDRQLCYDIGLAGLDLIKDGMGVLTHCNAGALATAGIGTATAPMYLAHQLGRRFRVYADETRPLLQGARLTAWELNTVGLDVTLITDSMAAHMMATGMIDLAIVGTDRVAANGDVANKIGTLGVAILAKHYGIPFYVACPRSTIDLETASGADIPIEERGEEEITVIGGYRAAALATQVRNPAFDITPHELVTGIITEKGILHPPFGEKLRNSIGRKSDV